MVVWFDTSGVAGVVIGGVAASILGRPRVTRDVDALVRIEEGRWQAFLESGRRFGFIPRIPDALAFAAKSRMLLVRHEPTTIDIDVTFAELPYESEVIERATPKAVGEDLILPLPAPEDLVVMKAIAGRPRDLADIEALLDAFPKIDKGSVRRQVREFTKALERPDLLEQLESLLRKP
jgi:hypothetical protein